jgi:outer membrane receptor protein involved in Fe transport
MKIDELLVRRPLAVALGAVLAASFAPPVLAQSDEGDEDDNAPMNELDRVVVTGSRIKRVEIEGPAPVVVITREDIDREGYQTVADILQTLTQNTTSSFTGDLAVNGFSPNALVVNLRNLGPGYTLTLINGRRPAQYPQPYNRDNNVVNVRAIPSSIIERVEILTGGASAIYGADAVAGVVNIVTRKGFDGNTVNMTVGTTGEGGGDSVDVEYTGGRSGEGWNTLFAFQYGHQEPVFADQRDFLRDSRQGPLGATGNPSLSLVAIRASASPAGPTNHNALYPGQAACDAFGYTTVTTATRGQYCGSFSQVASRSISNKYEFYSAYGSGTFDVSDTSQIFGSVTYYASDAASSSGTEFWGTAGDQFNRNAAGAQTSVYFDPTLNHLVQLQRVFNPFELGGPEAATTLFDEKTYDVTLGMNGLIWDRFDWEASVMHSEYEFEADRPRLLAQAVHDYFLGPQQGFISGFPINTLNRDRWFTPITPEIYRSFSTRVLNQSETSSSTLNFTLSGDLFDLPAGPLGFAAVMEAGRQELDLRSDPRLDPLRPRDDQTVYNLVSSGRTEGERDRYAIGAEFRVPITSSFTANLAGRWDKYDDISSVDDAFTYQMGLEWRLFDSFMLRGSAATSFRAPDMQLVYAQGAASFSTILDDFLCRSGTGSAADLGPRSRVDCNVAGDPTIYQTQTTIAGNPLLKEEEGESYSYGFVWDVMDGMSMTVDYYRIKLEDAASQLSAAFLLDNEANCRLGQFPDGSPFNQDISSPFCQNVIGLITRQSAPGTLLDQRIQRINSAYINTAFSDNAGIDATLKYNWETDNWGAFRLDLGYSVVLHEKFKQFADDELIDFRDDLGNLNQRSRVRGSIGWNQNDWNVTVSGVRLGSNGNWVEAAGTNGVGTEYGPRLKPFITYNLQVGRTFTPKLRGSFTVVNVTDNQYREDASQTGYPFFNNFIGADPLGRRFYATVEYSF